MDQQVQRIQRIRVAKIANKIASTGQVLGSAPVTLRTCHKIVRQPAISVGALQIQRIRGGEGALRIRVAKTINKIASTGQVLENATVTLHTCHKIVRQPAISVGALQPQQIHRIRAAKMVNKIASTGQVLGNAPVTAPTCHKIVRQPAMCVDELQGGVVTREMVPYVHLFFYQLSSERRSTQSVSCQSYKGQSG